MARMGLSFAGTLVDGLFGLPFLGLIGGTIFGAMLYAAPKHGGPKLSDLHVTASTYGTPIQWGWGTARISGNIIWSKSLVQHKHSDGGKGGSSTYTYSWTGGVSLCSTEFTGPVKMILRIWADTKIVYDATGKSGFSNDVPGNQTGGKGFGGNPTNPNSSVINGPTQVPAFNKLGTFRLVQGTQDQMPDPGLEDFVGADNAEAYRGQAVVVFDDVDVENYGNRVPNWTFEVIFNNDDSAVSQTSFKFAPSTDSTLSSNCGAIDTFRQQFYLIGPSTGDATDHGIHTMSFLDGHELSFTPWAGIIGSSDYFPNTSGMIVADDGNLWIAGGSTNYQAMLRIDPNAMKMTGQIGFNEAGPSGPTDPSVSQPTYNTTFSISGTPGMLVAGQIFHDLHALNLKGMGQIGDTFTYTDHRLKVTGPVNTGSDTVTCFGLGVPDISSGSTTDPLVLYQIQININGMSVSPLASITPALVDTQWADFRGTTQFIMDLTDGNVMFFVGTNSTVTGTDHHPQYLIKVSGTTGEIVWAAPYGVTANNVHALPGNPDDMTTQTKILGGVYAFIDDTDSVWTCSTQDGAMTRTPWQHTTTAGSQAYVDTFGAIIFYGDQGTVFTNSWGIIVENASALGQSLATIMSDICGAVGLQSGDLDVTALVDTNVEGYLLNSQTTARDGITPLASAFLFDGVETDDVLKFVPRGGDSVVTVPATDLVYLDTDKNSLINETRVQEVDLPQQISLTFIDPEHSYEAGVQFARRMAAPFPTVFCSGTITQQYPLVSENGYMAQLAENILYSTWIERVSVKVRLPWQYTIYDPTDVMVITSPDGAQYEIRMQTQSIGADLTNEWTGVAQSPTTYLSQALGDGGDGFLHQVLLPPSPSKLFLLDLPLLRDADDRGQGYTLLYDAAAGYTTSWPGATISESSDDINFTDGPAIASVNGAAWGVATTALGDTDSPFSPDYTNSVTIAMVTDGDELANATLLQVCNGANAFVIFNSATGIAEVVQFMTVVVNPDGTYTLSGLLRGRRGTEVYTSGHMAGDTFVLLTTTNSTIYSISMDGSDMNVPRFFKATTFGALPDSTLSQSFTDTGRAWKPYAPVFVAAALAGSDIDLTWVRRTRIGGELKDLTGDVPLSEQSEAYEVDIYNALGDTVLRTLRVDYTTSPAPTPGVTYTAAQIAEDFGSTPTSLNVAVYQISTVIGRGFGNEQTVQVT